MTRTEGRLGTALHQDLAQFIWKLKIANALAAFHLRSLFSEETVPWSLNNCTGLGASGTRRQSALLCRRVPRGTAVVHLVSGVNTRAAVGSWRSGACVPVMAAPAAGLEDRSDGGLSPVYFLFALRPNVQRWDRPCRNGTLI